MNHQFVTRKTGAATAPLGHRAESPKKLTERRMRDAIGFQGGDRAASSASTTMNWQPL